jgi:protein TonB
VNGSPHLRTTRLARRRRRGVGFGVLVALGANAGVALALALLTPRAPAPAVVLPPLPTAVALELPPDPAPRDSPPESVEPVAEVRPLTAAPPSAALPPLDLSPVGMAPALPVAPVLPTGIAVDPGPRMLPALFTAGLPVAGLPVAGLPASGGAGSSRSGSPPPPDQPARLLGALDLQRHYPRAARARGLHGVSRIEFDLSAEGGVSAVRCLASDPPGVFDEAVVRLGRSLRFQPAQRQGRPIPTTTTLRIDWVLK